MGRHTEIGVIHRLHEQFQLAFSTIITRHSQAQIGRAKFAKTKQSTRAVAAETQRQTEARRSLVR